MLLFCVICLYCFLIKTHIFIITITKCFFFSALQITEEEEQTLVGCIIIFMMIVKVSLLSQIHLRFYIKNVYFIYISQIHFGQPKSDKCLPEGLMGI